MIETYRPSGQPGILTLPLWCLALLGAIAAAYVYQLALHWIPLIYLNFFMTVGIGFGCGWLTTQVIKRGPCRNVALAALLGAFLCLILLASKHWFQYESFLSSVASEVVQKQNVPANDEAELKRLIRSKLSFMTYVEHRVEQGWQIGRAARAGRNRAPVNGVFVYLVWLLEAGIILFFGIVQPIKAARLPFNEMLQRWASEETIVATIPMKEASVIDRLRNAQLIEDVLMPPAPDPTARNQFLVYKVNSIEGEEMEDAFLSVSRTTVTTNKKGEPQTKEKKLFEFAVLKKNHREQLMQNIQEVGEAAAAEQEKRQAELEQAAKETNPDDFKIDTSGDS